MNFGIFGFIERLKNNVLVEGGRNSGGSSLKGSNLEEYQVYERVLCGFFFVLLYVLVLIRVFKIILVSFGVF